MSDSWITLLNGKRMRTVTSNDVDGNPVHTQVVIVGGPLDGNAVAPGEALQEPLRLDGAALGSADWAVDGSVTPQVFSWIVPTGEVAAIRSLEVVITCTLADVDLFGGEPALTNGLKLEVYSAGDVAIDLAPLTIKANVDWQLLGGVLRIESGNNVDMVLATVDLCPGGRPLLMSAGDSLRLTVRDDLSTVGTCRAVVRGERG